MGREYITTTSFTSPWVDTYPWDNGFKTKYSAPSTIFHSSTPGSVALCPKFTPNGNAIVYVYGTSPRMGAYPFSDSGGYGTAFVGSTPTTGTTGSGLSFISQTEFAASSNSSPYAQSLTFSTTSGFGATRYSAPSAPLNGRFVSASSNVAFFSFAASPFIGMWPTANPGFGAKFANPASTPTNGTTLYGPSIAHNANDVALLLAQSPYYAVWQWSISTGFGTRYTITVPTASTTTAVAWSPSGNAIALGDSQAPLRVFPWVTGTGPGTAYSNPATTIPGRVYSISFGKDTIFAGHVGSPYLSAFPWSDASGFGTKYANPSTAITAATVIGSSYINILDYRLNALPYAFNGLTYSQSGVYSSYENATELVMTDGLGTSRVQTVAYTEAGTYAETYVQLDLGKASVINGIVVGTDYSSNMGFSQVYTDNKDLSVSTNGSSWTTVGSTGTFTSSIKTVSITPVSARYIKVSKPGGDAFASYLPVTQFYPTTTSSYQFNGIAANLVKGSAPKVLVADVRSFTFTGNAATLTKSAAVNYTIIASAGSFSLAGIATGLAISRKMTAAKGTFSFTGIAAGLKVGRVVTATTRSFTLTGVAANLKAARTITGAARTFALTGINNRLSTTRTITVAAQSFSLIGYDANLVATTSKTLFAATGHFNLTGQASNLKSTRTIACSTSSFTVVGKNTGTAVQYKIIPSFGSFSLTGISSRIIATRQVACVSAQFTTTGISNRLLLTRKIIATSNAFTLTGYGANLVTTASRTIFAATGHFTLTGISSILSKGSRALASVGIFTVGTSPAGLASTRIIVSGPGNFSLSGQSSTLAFNRKLPISSRQFIVSGIASDLFRTRSLYATPRQFLLTGNTAYLKTIHPPIICQAGTFTLPVLAAATRYSNSKVSEFPPRLEFNSTGKNVNLKPSRAIIGTMSFAMEQTACALRWHRI